MRKALVSFTYEVEVISFLIPKLNGEGYVKSPFGGHHSNSAYEKMLDLNCIGDLYDTEGYCHLSASKEDWEEIKTQIEMIFPRITDWEELSADEFYNMVLRVL